MERWVSGLNQFSAKEPRSKGLRGFKSRSLRQSYMYDTSYFIKIKIIIVDANIDGVNNNHTNDTLTTQNPR